MKLLLTFMLMLFAPLALMAQPKPSTQIKFESTVHDFGEIKELDGKAIAVFKFQNTSDKPYIIRNISVGCGCTTPKYKKAPIMPGEKSEIYVAYDPEDRPGEFSRALFVVDGSGKFVNEIRIKGDVIARPQTVEDLYPITLNDGLRLESLLATYNSVAVGYKHNLMIDTYNSSDKDISLKTTIKGGNGRFVVYASPSILKPKEKGQIFINYDLKQEPKIYGRFATEVILSINDKPVSRPMLINGVSAPDFTDYTPDMIRDAAVGGLSDKFHSFGDIKAGEVTTKTFTLESFGVSDLEILDLSTDNEAVSAKVSSRRVKTGEKIVLTVSIAPKDSEKGRISASVLIVTNDQSMPLKWLRISANVK